MQKHAIFLAIYILFGLSQDTSCTTPSLDNLDISFGLQEIRRNGLHMQLDVQDSLKQQQKPFEKENSLPLFFSRSRNSLIQNQTTISDTLPQTTPSVARNQTKRNLPQTTPISENNSTEEFCRSAEDPYISALMTFTYNVAISIALAPVGFIGIFVRDALNNGCKCSEKVAPEPEKPSSSIPSHIVMVSNEANDIEKSADSEHVTSKTEELGKIKIVGKSIGISEYYQSAVSLLYNIGYRTVFVFIHIMNRNYVNPSLFAIDVCMAIYFGIKKMYCPGCLYNDLHVLIYKRKFVHVRTPRSFSL